MNNEFSLVNESELQITQVMIRKSKKHPAAYMSLSNPSILRIPINEHGYPSMYLVENFLSAMFCSFQCRHHGHSSRCFIFGRHHCTDIKCIHCSVFIARISCDMCILVLHLLIMLIAFMISMMCFVNSLGFSYVDNYVICK